MALRPGKWATTRNRYLPGLTLAPFDACPPQATVMLDRFENGKVWRTRPLVLTTCTLPLAASLSVKV